MTCRSKPEVIIDIEGGRSVKESDANPMQSAHDAQRCTAKSKRTGQPCKAPAVRGWSVCRMHGAGGGAKAGAAHPNWKHGGRSADAVAVRHVVSLLARKARSVSSVLNDD